MARKNTLSVEECSNLSLDELVSAYYMNKQELDSYKKIVDRYNQEIKTEMYNKNLDTYSTDHYTAKRTVVVKESFDESALIQVLKKFNIHNAIKTKEYIDFDALENELYNSAPSPELATEIEKCKKTTEVIQLRVSKNKNKEN